VRRATDGRQQVRHLRQVPHLLDGGRGEVPAPAAHHRGLFVGHDALADVVLERVCGEQIDAGQSMFKFGSTCEQIDELFSRRDGRDMRAIELGAIDCLRHV